MVEARVGALQAVADGVHLGALLTQGDARPHARQHDEEAAVIDAGVARVHAQWDPHVGGGIEHAKPGRQHSHDGVTLVVETDALAGDGAVRAEPPPPQAIAQQGGSSAAGLVLVGPE